MINIPLLNSLSNLLRIISSSSEPISEIPLNDWMYLTRSSIQLPVTHHHRVMYRQS